MGNKNLVNESSYPTENDTTAAAQLISSYKEFLGKASKLYPKVGSVNLRYYSPLLVTE